MWLHFNKTAIKSMYKRRPYKIEPSLFLCFIKHLSFELKALVQ